MYKCTKVYTKCSMIIDQFVIISASARVNLAGVMWKLTVMFCASLVIANANAFVRREVPSSSQPNVLASFQKNMDQFKHCLDQSLAMAAGDVNENQLKPVFTVLGDSINRFSKAFEDLTATTKRPDPDFDF